MARIRSIHPGFFTDDAVLSCSLAARMLYIGLWVESDCQGVFQWRPVQLKVRILPMEPLAPADVAALLDELVQADLIKPFKAEGSDYGAVKGFKKYQRPKNPSNLYPLPAAYTDYVSTGATAGGDTGDDDGQFPPEAQSKVVPLPQRSPSAPPPEGENARMESETDRRGEEGGAGETSPRKRGSRLPEDWEPDAELIAYGVSLGFGEAKVLSAAERFKLHWHASSKANAVKLDWRKAFQGWIREDMERHPPAKAKGSMGVW